MKKILATILAAALGLGAWAADPVTIQDAGGNNISVYEVSSGFYQSGTTYNNSTDFYITNLNGLKFFRDFVNGETAASYAYFTATGVTGTYPTTPAGINSFHSNNMFNGKTVHLVADIDLAGEQWITIGFNRAGRMITDPDTSVSASVQKCTFFGLFDAGIYDGEGNLTGTHVISNLDTSWQYVPEAATLQEKYQLTGLFGQLSGGTTAGVKNLTVRNATVVGRTDVGVIAGRSYNGGAKIENCHVVGNVNVSGTGTYIGGLVGECRASILNSSVDAAAGSSISGLAYVGGLAGSVFQYNANDSVEVSGSAVSNTAVNASYSGVAGVGALVGVTNPNGTYHGNVVISGNEANNVPVSAPNSSASKGGVGTLVGNALYDDGAYAIVADNTVSGTTSATAGGDAVTVKMGEANDNIAVGANVTFDANNKITGGIFEVINEEIIASGYLSSDNPDTTTSANYPLTIGGPYVALIGTTPYPSLADAVAAVPENGAEATTITMFADTELAATVVIPANKNIVLDLNGKAITVPDATPHIYAIRNNGTMTLKDSVGSGSIAARGVYNGPDNTSAKMTVEGGTYYNLDTDGGAAIFNKAELTVNNGTFNGKVCLNNSGSAAKMVVNGATANGTGGAYAVQNNGGTVTINDITANGKFGAFGQWQDTSTTTINGGTFAIVDNTYAGYTHHCVYVGAGDLTINGGSFTNGDNQADSGLALYMASSGTTTITDGTFTNLAPDAGGETISLWGGSGALVVSGGVYNRQVKAEYCAADYSPTTTADAGGMYTVVSDYEAQIVRDGVVVTPKGSLTAMIAAAQAGDTIQLLKDIALTTPISAFGKTSAYSLAITKSLTIDGQGLYKITSSATRGIGVGGDGSNIDVTFKDIVVETSYNNSNGNIIETRGNIGTLTLDHATLTHSADLWWCGAVQIGGNQADKANVVIKDSTIDPGREGYPIVSWNPMNLEVTGSTLTGYCATYMKGINGSAGSGGSTVSISNSVITVTNTTSDPSYSFGVFVFEKQGGGNDNTTINLVDSTVTLNATTGGNEYILYLNNGVTDGMSGNTVNVVQGNRIWGNGNVRLNNYGVLNLSTGVLVGGDAAGLAKIDESVSENYGYIVNEEGVVVDGHTYYPLELPPVAQIGETKYTSLADAIAAVPADGTATTITMIADETINSNAGVTIPAGKNVVLDLNGKTITGVVQSATTAQTILNKGTFVITDSSDEKNGKITNVVSDENAGSPMAKNWASNVIRNEGDLTVNSGNIINTGNGGACYAIDNYSSGKVTINGGTLDAARASVVRMFYNNGGKVTVNGGSIGHNNSDSDRSYMGVQVQAGTDADVEISGGNIASQYAVYSAGTEDSSVSISGGTFDGYVGVNDSISEDNISISGGTFNAWVGTWGTQEGFISGGNFSSAVPEGYCADGYIPAPKDPDTGYYTVKHGTYVAQIGTTKYESLAEAFAAVPADGTETTITMIADSVETVASTNAAGKNVVLDLNGKAVSYTSDFPAAFNLITVNGTLTVTDTSADADGSIALTSTANLSWDYAVNMFLVGNGGSLTIEKGSYSVTTPSYGYAEYVIAASNNSGASTVVINGGTFTGNNIDAVVRLHDQYGRNQPLNVTVNGGDFTLNGSQCDSVIWFDVQKSGNGTDNASVANLVINGGTFTSTSASPALDIGHSVDASGLRVTVAGGAFKSNGAVIKTRELSAAAIANIKLSGGIYSGDEYYNDLTKTTDKLDTLCAAGYKVANNIDDETKDTYPYVVGLVKVFDIAQQPGATETRATYVVTVVAVDEDDQTVGTFDDALTVEVSIAAADVAGSTLAKYDVSKILDTALLSAGEDAFNVTKVEICVVISEPSSGEGTVSYEVHPEAVVTVTKDATDTTTTIPLSNACLAADASFTFDLDATGVVAAGDWAKVTHVSTDPNYAAEARNLKAVAGDGGKVYVTVTTTHFSTFTIGAGVPPVTFGVRSDNLFGSIKIEGNVASNLYVATLFEGFEADGALRKAQDVVHATNLTAGTKMYVYDKNADKYDVFEVDANGKWAAALKINVTEMTNTFDTADLTRGVTNGTGVIVGRKNTAETVYVYGQVPKIPIASTTFGAGQTLVSPPYTNGVECVDLNASTWTGVKATQLKRLKNQKGADYIQFRTADNRLVKYFYLEGEGWGVVPTQVSQFSEFVANGKALIPVGTAFWYYSTSGGAKVEWK